MIHTIIIVLSSLLRCTDELSTSSGNFFFSKQHTYLNSIYGVCPYFIVFTCKTYSACVPREGSPPRGISCSSRGIDNIEWVIRLILLMFCALYNFPPLQPYSV